MKATQESIEKTRDIVDTYVSNRCGVSVDDIHSKKRYKDLVEARMRCYFVLRYRYHLSMSNIARLYDRDHTTVLAQLRKAVKKDLDYSIELESFSNVALVENEILCNGCGRDIRKLGQDNMNYGEHSICEGCVMGIKTNK